MEGFLLALEQSQLAMDLRVARWGYAAINAAHIFGIAVLVGGILPLDFRLIGFWPNVDRRSLARVLVPFAVCGLVIAMVTGLILFSVRAREYADLSILWTKLTLVAVGATSAILAHVRYGLWLDRSGPSNLPHVGLISIICWMGALACGRLIAFAE